jgi:hypothetical protein
MSSFNSNLALMNLAFFYNFCVCSYAFLITLMLADMFVFNVNTLGNSGMFHTAVNNRHK